ncbi:hypothetical protein [Streptomyces tendae]|uniref:hypothetical protein n=1 Tax=Streptomyces tendae TaxID=1932 RepID=UPI003EBAB1F8
MNTTRTHATDLLDGSGLAIDESANYALQLRELPGPRNGHRARPELARYATVTGARLLEVLRSYASGDHPDLPEGGAYFDRAGYGTAGPVFRLRGTTISCTEVEVTVLAVP